MSWWNPFRRKKTTKKPVVQKKFKIGDRVAFTVHIGIGADGYPAMKKLNDPVRGVIVKGISMPGYHNVRAGQQTWFCPQAWLEHAIPRCPVCDSEFPEDKNLIPAHGKTNNELCYGSFTPLD